MVNIRTQTTALVSRIAQKEKDFKETLERLVAKLNVNFSLFMENIKCKGVVELINGNNFNLIGLDIKVSFRKDQDLQSLNGMVQSGGVGMKFMVYFIGKVFINNSLLIIASGDGFLSFPFYWWSENNEFP